MYFPQYGHYCMFLLALNFGFSVLDLLYLKILVFSNYGNYIEEHQSGIHFEERKIYRFYIGFKYKLSFQVIILIDSFLWGLF